MGNGKLYIVDTTLRDGEQRAGLAFSPKSKAACARIMDRLGVFQIEAGIPSMGTREKEAIIAVKECCRHTLVSAWCRMVPHDILDAFDCHPDIIHIGVPVSDLMIQAKLKKDRQYVREQMLCCVELAVGRGYMVTLGLEDASRADLSFMASLITAVLPFGVRRVRYADTVGIAVPHKIARDIAYLTQSEAQIEVHAHNDLGLAVANTLEAAKHGVLYADTTFFGIGERAGNCDLYKLITALGDNWETGLIQDVAEAQQNIGSVLDLYGMVPHYG